MSLKSTRATWLLLLAAIVAGGSLAFSKAAPSAWRMWEDPAPPPQPTFDATQIPYEVRRSGSWGYLRQGYQAGRVFLSAFDKQLEIQWTASAVTNSPTPPDWTLPYDMNSHALGNNVIASTNQTLRTRFYPTACCTIDATSLLFGGVTEDGRTIIERWTFAWPNPMPDVAIDVGTGLTSVAVAIPSVLARVRIYDEDTTGRRFVRNLAGLKVGGASTHAALVQFFDSNDVYQIEVATGQVALVASAVAAGGTLGVVSGLAPANQDSLAVGDRPAIGFCYMLGRGLRIGTSAPAPTDPPIVVFVDQDRNGGVDSVLQFAFTDYVAQGWANLQNYANYWLP